MQRSPHLHYSSCMKTLHHQRTSTTDNCHNHCLTLAPPLSYFIRNMDKPICCLLIVLYCYYYFSDDTTTKNRPSTTANKAPLPPWASTSFCLFWGCNRAGVKTPASGVVSIFFTVATLGLSWVHYRLASLVADPSLRAWGWEWALESNWL